MLTTISSFSQLSDHDLLAQVERAAHNERHATVQLIALLMELDARRLYLAQGCASLYTYCTQVLHLSEHVAYGRIEAARAARRFPVILERLADGRLSLTAVGLLAPHLTADNHLGVLDAAVYKSKRDVEQLVARLHPKPDVPAGLRKLPVRRSLQGPHEPDSVETCEASGPEAPLPSLPPASIRPAEVKPLAPERYKVQFTVNCETYEKLRRAQDLLRQTIPNGDPAAIFDKALTLLLEHLSRAKLASSDRPRPQAKWPHGRHIPAAVKRTVWQRDGGRCAFRGARGRCTETGFLEFHHVVPYASGGKATTVNVELRCKAHNQYEAEQYFGPPLVRESCDAYPLEAATRSGPS